MYATALAAVSAGAQLRMDWWSTATGCTEWATRYASGNLSYVQMVQ